MPRAANIERNTNETQIKLELNLDGTGKSNIFTEVGFLDHMLSHVSKHGFIDIFLNTEGDLEVDCHHTVEDVGIVIGKAIDEALGDKAGIVRYGHAIVPMEEALVLCAIDISGRAYLNFEAKFTTPRLGSLDSEMVEEFFRALCLHAKINMHIQVLAGKNNHHIAEAMFKAFGRAMGQAITIDPRVEGVLSTKGMLE